MRFSSHHPFLFFGGVLCASAAIAALGLWVLAHAQTPFDYMVVGCLAATVALGVIFGAAVLRAARKSGRAS